ncbi:MAG: HAD-IA family hydrolase [Symbiobacteriia bacterium]
MTKSYKAILFDAGDTLVRLARPFAEIMLTVLAEAGFHTDRDRLEAAIREVFREADEARANMPVATQTSDEVAKAYWLDLYLEIGRRVGLPGLALAHVTPIYEYLLAEQPFVAVAGAEELLAWCKGQGYRLGLVSNWGTDLRDLLGRLGLARFFDTLVISAEVGMEKPSPRIFLQALKGLGVNAQDALMVGDDYVNDGMGAWAVGIDPLLVDVFDRFAAGTWPRVLSLADVKTYLEQGGVAK